MMETELLFALFFVKHFICDFPLQTNAMVQNKGTCGHWQGLAHSGLHGVGTLLILGPLAALVDAVVHYHVDWAKMQIGKRKKYTPADKAFWNWIGADQLAHYLTYAGLIYWLAAS